MAKKQANPFDDDFALPTPTAPSPAVAAPAQALQPKAKTAEPAPEVKRGRGRPAGPQKDTQPTTLRLHPDDHRLVRDLARNDEIQMNELIYDALQAYCKTRAVHLKHAPGKAKGIRK